MAVSIHFFSTLHIARTLSIGGLILDIVGVVILFRFGLPPRLAMFGVLTLDRDDAFRKKERRYQIWSYVALSCLVIGFILQIIGVCIYPVPGH